MCIGSPKRLCNRVQHSREKPHFDFGSFGEIGILAVCTLCATSDNLYASDRPIVNAIVSRMTRSSLSVIWGSSGDIHILAVTNLCATSEVLCASDRPNVDTIMFSNPWNIPSEIFELFGEIDFFFQFGLYAP